MNNIDKELDSCISIFVGDELRHYGTKYHSGRYPWGSGNDPYQRTGDLLSRVETLKKEGFSEN